MTFSDLKQLLVVDYNKAVIRFYNENRTSFLTWAMQRYSLDQDGLLDIYQDAIIVLYNMILENKVEHINSSPEAYLFGIAKNLINKSFKKQIDVVSEAEVSIELGTTDAYMNEFYKESHIQTTMEQALKKLKGNCREILELYYYRQYKMEAISEKLNLKNTDVVKSRKAQCLKALKSIIGVKGNIV